MQVWTNIERNGPIDFHEYNIVDDGRKKTLFFSNDKAWTNPGEEAGYVVDDGNGIKVKLHGKDQIELEYHEVTQLLSLLLCSYEDKLEIKETKTIKKL